MPFSFSWFVESATPKTLRSGLVPKDHGVNRRARKLADVVITYGPAVHNRSIHAMIFTGVIREHLKIVILD